MFGMSLTAFTMLHVAISIIGIVAGLFAVSSWLKSDVARVSTAIFLGATILTSVTGFLFPFKTLLPSHIVGILSLVLLAFATFALYAKDLSGFWRLVYAVTAISALYLNVFILIIQSFLKIPVLKAWAPTQTGPAFLAVQGITFILFFVIAILTVLKFKPKGLAPSY